jgi:hypothetical protein
MPSTRTISLTACSRRMGLTSAYSGDVYQRFAASTLGSACTTHTLPHSSHPRRRCSRQPWLRPPNVASTLNRVRGRTPRREAASRTPEWSCASSRPPPTPDTAGLLPGMLPQRRWQPHVRIVSRKRPPASRLHPSSVVGQTLLRSPDGQARFSPAHQVQPSSALATP